MFDQLAKLNFTKDGLEKLTFSFFIAGAIQEPFEEVVIQSLIDTRLQTLEICQMYGLDLKAKDNIVALASELIENSTNLRTVILINNSFTAGNTEAICCSLNNSRSKNKL